jgi:hypothetical protein
MNIAVTTYGPVRVDMQKVKAIKYTKHATTRALERGISKADLAVAVTRPTHVLKGETPNTIRVIDKHSLTAAVLTTTDGSVLTTYRISQGFDFAKYAIATFAR